jgi:hypothetical protein
MKREPDCTMASSLISFSHSAARKEIKENWLKLDLELMRGKLYAIVPEVASLGVMDDCCPAPFHYLTALDIVFRSPGCR